LKYNDKVAECDEAIVETWAEKYSDKFLSPIFKMLTGYLGVIGCFSILKGKYIL
jgi:cobalamin biosynthesis protein CobD/CbiB